MQAAEVCRGAGFLIDLACRVEYFGAWLRVGEGVRVLAADRIEHNGHGLGGLGNVLLVVVDDLVCAETLQVVVVARGGDGDDVTAGRARRLYRRAADASGGA